MTFLNICLFKHSLLSHGGAVPQDYVLNISAEEMVKVKPELEFLSAS